MKRMSPLQAGVAWGVPAGVVVGMTAMLSGVYRVEGLVAGLMDVVLAFALGAVMIGGIAAFVQWRRIVNSLGDVAPPETTAPNGSGPAPAGPSAPGRHLPAPRPDASERRDHALPEAWVV